MIVIIVVVVDVGVEEYYHHSTEEYRQRGSPRRYIRGYSLVCMHRVKIN